MRGSFVVGYIFDFNIVIKSASILASSGCVILYIRQSDFWHIHNLKLQPGAYKLRLVCLHVTTREPHNGFSQNMILGRFTKACRNITTLVTIGQE
jgi:hypothetical protein